MSSAFYEKEELLEMGFSSVGTDVAVSRLCSLYAISGSIGSGTRIDDFCVIKGAIDIGKKVHICSHCSISAVGGHVKIGDLCGIGVNNIFYTASDDMLSSALCGPLVAKDHTALKTGRIALGTGVALGGRNTVMPGTVVGDFSAFGLNSVLIGDFEAHAVYMNVNGKLRRIGKRDADKLNDYAFLELS